MHLTQISSPVLYLLLGILGMTALEPLVCPLLSLATQRLSSTHSQNLAQNPYWLSTTESNPLSPLMGGHFLIKSVMLIIYLIIIFINKIKLCREGLG